MTNTHNLIVQFGMHRGERWTRLPVSYLRWLANQQTDSTEVKIARSELERRGTVLEHTVELSSHAIDRASLRCSRQWKDSRLESEGLYSWLMRLASAALASTQEERPEVVIHEGMKFVFVHGHIYPTLKSVMPVHP